VSEKKLIFVNRFFAPDESASSLMLTDLADALSGRGLRTHVVTSRLRSDDPSDRLPSDEVRGNIRVDRVFSSRFGRGNLAGRAIDYLTFYLFAAWRLARLLRHGDILVVKTDPPLLAAVAAPLARWRKARLVNWIQDLYPETAGALGIIPGNGGLFRWLQSVRDHTLRSAAANVVIGEQMAARIRERGVPADRIAVIPNWADGGAIGPLPDAENPLRREWFPEQAFVVAYSGNMGRAHELSAVLDAAQLLAAHRETTAGDRFPAIRFLFIGSGHQRDNLEDEVRCRGLDNVLFRPFQPRENLQRSLGAGDLHVVSLKPDLEGLILPSKLYGILAAGRPALFLGSADSEIARLLTRHDCGTRAPPDEPAAIRDAIVGYLEDPERLARQGRNARLLFDASFSLEQAVERWVDLIDAVSGSGGNL
jgi:glycosyltransferase involved in cell wall biosynthesis